MTTNSTSAESTRDSYKLSPLQQGMLLHTLRDTGVGMYINQATYVMEDLDPDALRLAWQRVLDRHNILRSSFHWEVYDPNTNSLISSHYGMTQTPPDR